MKKRHNNVVIDQIKHTCSTCLRVITDENYIQCTVCKGFQQCLECYAYGMEIKNHVRDHQVVLVEAVQPAVFSKDWSLEEELNLLRETAACGIGNWVDIAQRVKTKTAAECEAHYFSIYCDCKTAPCPDYDQPPQDPTPLPDPLPFDTAPQKSLPSDGDEAILALLNKSSKSTPAEISGYMPKRHEFEDEFNEDIDHLIDNIDFNNDTTEQQLEEYCTLLELYNSQLIERTRRTEVIEDWGIQYSRYKSLGGTTTQERDIDSKILPFAQYIGKANTENLANLLRKLNRNKNQIEVRRKWHKNGVQTHSEGFLFNKLESCIRDNKVPDSEIPKWNRAIIESMQHTQSVSEDEKFLSEKELDFCKNEKIQPHIYSSIKGLYIREFAARGRLTKNEALHMVPQLEDIGELIYYLLLSFQWISE